MTNIFDTPFISDITLVNQLNHVFPILGKQLGPNLSKKVVADLEINLADFRKEYSNKKSKLRRWIDNGLIEFTITQGTLEPDYGGDTTPLPIDDKSYSRTKILSALGVSERVQGGLRSYHYFDDFTDKNLSKYFISNDLNVSPWFEPESNGCVKLTGSVTHRLEYLDLLSSNELALNDFTGGILSFKARVSVDLSVPNVTARIGLSANTRHRYNTNDITGVYLEFNASGVWKLIKSVGGYLYGVNEGFTPIANKFHELSIVVDSTQQDHVYSFIDESGQIISSTIVESSEHISPATFFASMIRKTDTETPSSLIIDYVKIDYDNPLGRGVTVNPPVLGG